ncbi:diphthine--ammonia ligase [Endozoicomonas lisbonensis]|uniref:Diphthine-ammonia ligase n=1 Tax=Endozoicomonas lisbonensis TaxID=3120522 RepID=A0ABV2SNV5_9GAMM
MPDNQPANHPYKNQFITSWSGGKDACYALHLAQQSGASPVALFTMLSEDGEHTSAHGLSRSVLQAQANAMGLPILFRSSGWGEYERHLKSVIAESQSQFQANTVVFGDIDLESHKVWFERVTSEAGIQAAFPLWLKSREALLADMLSSNIRTIIVSIQSERLPDHLLGQIMTPQLARDIKNLGICPSGEDGEFHTLVVDAPLFSKPMNISTGTTQSIAHGYTALEVSVV